MAAGERPRIADIIPRLQLRGAEVFAQHLETALQPRYDSHLFTMFGEGEERITGPDLKINRGPRGAVARRVRAVRSLGKRVRAFRPELIVAHGGDPLRAASIAGLYRVAPIVYLRVSSVPVQNLQGRRGASLRSAYSHASAFVAVSESLKEELTREFEIGPERIRVIRNGRPRLPEASAAERYELRSSVGASDDDVLVAWCGGFVAEKNPTAAVELARKLQGISSVRLVMIGDGPLLNECRQSAGGLTNIRFAGSRADFPQIVGASDMLVSTSTTEGAPGVIIEALLAGVPVIAPNVGGIGETVGTLAGILTDPKDPNAISNAVSRLTSDTPMRSQMAEAAGSAGSRFDIVQIADEYDALFLDVLKRRK